ncbi:sigma-70 family RNA polymerase sigma factor [Bacillus massiliigorillae]|uniref:sigma-70 family RNA polymerase sigma factor n=1 Tax=Bacillus massiliigorillae TaxID=1243664 RepID=UPI0003A5E74D
MKRFIGVHSLIDREGEDILNKLKLVHRAKKGHNQAFQQLIDEEKVRLYKIARLYVKNEEDALEIFQETLYKAYISLKNLKEDRYFSTWITRILINTAYDFLKKQKRVIPLDSVIIEDQNLQYNMPEENSDLIKAIEELDVKYKTVLILRYYKDYSIKQIAEIVECPEGTVKTNIHRGLQLLRMKIEEGCINE